ncbi:hypothetical protein B9T31_12260 [Acinetobacter sp. ANC 4558]|uniref:hypothetical protein n=1 Tax=Acinetobacter sp. ANC 4558 TaxID=1977876 RepID=UPI000A35BDF7|nr:hypothetical protein [Acinetobacter sp. ANC 4558]OTG85557.1 hypothetical protein B9T31_12260 [Acinetobacter sp. ANC 4558]
MSLIQKVGGLGQAQIITSEILTRASCPNCYFPEKKVYGFADAHDDQIYFFDEESCQFFNVENASEPLGEYVLLIDLKVEICEVVS